jgi:hypothetical protein
LDAFFTGYKLATIGPAEITRYVAKRQAQTTQMAAARDDSGEITARRPTSNGTINRELGVLGRMLRLAYENGKLLRLPVLRKLERRPRAPASSSVTSTKPCAGTWRRISKLRARSPTRSAGACGPKSSLSSVGTWTSRPGRCASIRA